jgi:hypothetical protein
MLSHFCSLAFAGFLALSSVPADDARDISPEAAVVPIAQPERLTLQDEGPPPVEVCQDEADALEEAGENLDEATEELERANELRDAWCKDGDSTLCAIAKALVIQHEDKALQALVDYLEAFNAYEECLLQNGSEQFGAGWNYIQPQAGTSSQLGIPALPLPYDSVLLRR